MLQTKVDPKSWRNVPEHHRPFLDVHRKVDCLTAGLTSPFSVHHAEAGDRTRRQAGGELGRSVRAVAAEFEAAVEEIDARKVLETRTSCAAR
jgi:hypothetical protein